jgi:hypothetical protein
MQFSVQWKSLPASEATWVRSSDLESHLPLIESYFQSTFVSEHGIQPKWIQRAQELLSPYRTEQPPTETSAGKKNERSVRRTPVIWEHPWAPIVVPFVEVIGTEVLNGLKYFIVKRSDKSVVYIDREKLIAASPCLLVDYLEDQLVSRSPIGASWSERRKNPVRAKRKFCEPSNWI